MTTLTVRRGIETPVRTSSGGCGSRETIIVPLEGVSGTELSATDMARSAEVPTVTSASWFDSEAVGCVSVTAGSRPWVPRRDC